jgi:multicomponent K+:H+ antiporter subunit C
VEALFSIVVGVLVACGVYLILRARTFPVVLGLTLMSYGVNVFLFASGGLVVGSAPLALPEITVHPDPLPQALVLTAIVIGFGMTAYAIVLALKANGELGTDHVDGEAGE